MDFCYQGDSLTAMSVCSADKRLNAQSCCSMFVLNTTLQITTKSCNCPWFLTKTLTGWINIEIRFSNDNV